MTPEEYRTYDAVGLAELVHAGQVTPQELAATARAEIDRANPTLNAVVHDLEAYAGGLLSAGLPEGPFHGVPWLLKDQIEVEGTPMTLGSNLLRGFICDRTHPVADRFAAAGLLPLGRTNMSEVGFVPFTEPRLYGPTPNPWNRAHSPGGSSGGSAAAVAAGLVPMAHAMDGGGSIRIPAAACGLVGLKPSRGRHPAAYDDDPDGFVSHLCVSRTVRDSAALLDATCAPHGGRWTQPPPSTPYAEVIARDPTPLRVGFTTKDLSGDPIHPEAERAVRTTAELLDSLGHHVEEITPPIDAEAFSAAFRVLYAAGAGVFYKSVRASLHKADLPALTRSLLKRPRFFRLAMRAPKMGLEPLTRRLERMDARMSASDLWLANTVLTQTAHRLKAWFEEYDVMLTTVLTRPPMRTGEFVHTGTDDALARRLERYAAFTPVANATGLPAISVPATVTEAEGLPMGAHFIGPMGREDRLLAIAAQIERARPWPKLAPTA